MEWFLTKWVCTHAWSPLHNVQVSNWQSHLPKKKTWTKNKQTRIYTEEKGKKEKNLTEQIMGNGTYCWLVTVRMRWRNRVKMRGGGKRWNEMKGLQIFFLRESEWEWEIIDHQWIFFCGGGGKGKKMEDDEVVIVDRKKKRKICVKIRMEGISEGFFI